jgi:hypothetical protein
MLQSSAGKTKCQHIPLKSQKFIKILSNDKNTDKCKEISLFSILASMRMAQQQKKQYLMGRKDDQELLTDISKLSVAYFRGV